MGSFSVWHWIIVIVVFLPLFGSGNKVGDVMADLARGVRAFKKNIAEPEDAAERQSTSHPSSYLADVPDASAPLIQTHSSQG